MRLFSALVAATLAGCAVGPDYHRPAPPAVASYTAEALPVGTAGSPGIGGTAQRFVSGGEIPARWWELFRSEALDRWIREALADSPTLDAAEATLRRAQEVRRARSGDLLPSVDGKVSASRQKPSGASLGVPNVQINPFTLYNASVDVSYTLDLFGRTRRELEALQAQVDYQGFQLEGAYLTLASNVVTAALQEASLRGQLQATRDILATQEEQLALIEKQFELGESRGPTCSPNGRPWPSPGRRFPRWRNGSPRRATFWRSLPAGFPATRRIFRNSTSKIFDCRKNFP